MGQNVDIKTDDGIFHGFLATPPAAEFDGQVGGIIILQEIFGVNAVMRDITEQFAAAGFVALCPDLFWRIEPDIDITDRSQAEWDRAFELFGQFDADKGIEDIQAAISYLRIHPNCAGRVGVVGYCLGGRLAYLSAARTDCDTAVGFYGVGIEGLLGEAPSITCPVLLHIAGKDQFVPPEAQTAIHGTLDGHAHITLYDYPDDDHAFARMGGAHYNAESTRIAQSRTLAHLRRTL